jgi:hypothetical protein
VIGGNVPDGRWGHDAPHELGRRKGKIARRDVLSCIGDAI